MKTINAITTILAPLFLVLIFNPYTDGTSVSPFQFENLSRSYTAIYVAGNSEELHYKFCIRNATMNSPEKCKDEVQLEKECGCLPHTENVSDDSFGLVVVKCNNRTMAYCPEKFAVSVSSASTLPTLNSILLAVLMTTIFNAV